MGLYYAMQGAKVGWIADDKYDPQIVADIERTARLGSADDVMAMVAEHGHEGFADFLMDNGYDQAFIDTLKMEPHYAGWMHDRAQGKLSIEGSPPRMTSITSQCSAMTSCSRSNDTWDWPQWRRSTSPMPASSSISRAWCPGQSGRREPERSRRTALRPRNVSRRTV